MRIGLISDTHGLLRPEALAALAGCTQLLHAGDIGDVALLERLRALAPVTAVRGNNDTAAWAQDLPAVARLQLDGVPVWMVHDLADLRPWPSPAQARVVVHGHSHRPGVQVREGVLCVNPGSAGRRRFTLPVSVGELMIDAGAVQARTIELGIAGPAR